MPSFSRVSVEDRCGPAPSGTRAAAARSRRVWRSRRECPRVRICDRHRRGRAVGLRERDRRGKGLRALRIAVALDGPEVGDERERQRIGAREQAPVLRASSRRSLERLGVRPRIGGGDASRRRPARLCAGGSASGAARDAKATNRPASASVTTASCARASLSGHRAVIAASDDDFTPSR